MRDGGNDNDDVIDSASLAMLSTHSLTHSLPKVNHIDHLKTKNNDLMTTNNRP